MSSSDNPQFDPQPVVSIEPPAPSGPEAVVISTPIPAAPPPVENPVWSGWDVLIIAGLTFVLTFVIVPVLIVLGAHTFAYPHESWTEVARKPELAILSEFLAYIAVAAYMIMLVEGKYHKPFWRAIRWDWERANPWLLGLGTLTVSLDLLGHYLPMPKTSPFDEFFAHPRDAYLIAAFAVTVGPLMEELLFRGFLYPALARRTGGTSAVLITSVLFGLIHYPQYRSWAAVLIVMLVGVVLTAVRAATKSVAASFLVHVGYNGTLMVMAALATDGFRHMPKAAIFLP